MGENESRMRVEELSFDRVRERLLRGLREPLPGPAAQRAMAPRPRPGWRPGRTPPGSRPAAALLLLYAREGRAWLPLTLRPPHLARHAGQVSLPGGAVEDGEDIATAALREAGEEIGLAEPAVEILGRLSPLYVPASGFELHPVVAALPGPPLLRPDPKEVTRILQVALDRLAHPRARAHEWRSWGGLRLRVPFFLVEGERVWGATAMILAELLAVLGVRLGRTSSP